jgi:hypothetical protein
VGEGGGEGGGGKGGGIGGGDGGGEGGGGDGGGGGGGDGGGGEGGGDGGEGMLQQYATMSPIAVSSPPPCVLSNLILKPQIAWPVGQYSIAPQFPHGALLLASALAPLLQ